MSPHRCIQSLPRHPRHFDSPRRRLSLGVVRNRGREGHHGPVWYHKNWWENNWDGTPFRTCPSYPFHLLVVDNPPLCPPPFHFPSMKCPKLRQLVSGTLQKDIRRKDTQLQVGWLYPSSADLRQQGIYLLQWLQAALPWSGKVFEIGKGTDGTFSCLKSGEFGIFNILQLPFGAFQSPCHPVTVSQECSGPTLQPPSARESISPNNMV